MKNNEKIKELMKLSNGNPELEIMCMVDNEIACDDYSWNLGVIGNIEIQEFWRDDELITRDEDEIKERLFYYHEGDDKYLDVTDKDFNKEIDKMYFKMKEIGEIKNAIFVNIILP